MAEITIDGHFVLETPFASLNTPVEQAELACLKISSYYKNESILARHPRLIRNYVYKCEHIMATMLGDQKELETLFKSHLSKKNKKFQVRNRRGVTALIGPALTLGTYLAKELIRLRRNYKDKNQRYVFAKIKGHQKTLWQLEQITRRISRTILTITKNITIDEDREVFSLHLDELLEVAQRAKNEMDKMTYGLFHLATGHVTRDLIPTDVMQQALDEMTIQAENRDLLVPIKCVEEAYLLPSSFMFSDRILTLFIHIPLMTNKPYMSILAIKPSPVSLNNDDINGIVKEEQMIAVSSDGLSFRVLDQKELERCASMHDETYFCNTNTLYKNFSFTCLSAIYKQDYQAASRLCSLYILPRMTFSQQIFKDTFFLFQHEPTNVHIRCGTNSYFENLDAGSWNLRLPNCSAESDDFYMKGYSDLSVRVTVHRSKINWNLDTITRDIDTTRLIEAMQHLHAVKPTSLNDLASKATLLTPTSHTGMYILVSCSITVLALIIAYIMLREWQGINYHRVKEAQEAEGEGELEIQERQAPIVRRASK